LISVFLFFNPKFPFRISDNISFLDTPFLFFFLLFFDKFFNLGGGPGGGPGGGGGGGPGGGGPLFCCLDYLLGLGFTG
jgi:hypothetical protein